MQVNVSSMMAHSNYMSNNATNVANANNNDYNSIDTTLQSNSKESVKAVSSTSNSGTNITKELTEQIPILNGFDANAQVIKTQNRILGSLLDLRA